MKIKYSDGTEGETSELRDYIALQIEEQHKFNEFCSKNGLYIWAFTLDSEGNGGAFFNMPNDKELREKFIINVDKKLRELTENRICLSFNDEDGERVF